MLHNDIGSAYDKWHIYPYNINKKSVVFSIGIGDDVSFDIDFIISESI